MSTTEIPKVEIEQPTTEQVKGKAKRIAKNKSNEATIKPRQPRKKPQLKSLEESIEEDIKQMEEHFKPKEESKPVEENKSTESPKLETAEIIPEKEEEVKQVKEVKQKAKRTRQLKDKKIVTNENGEKTYEYIYEIIDADGKVISTQTVSNNKKVSGLKKYDPSMNEELGQTMETWLTENNINKSTLYKRINLDKHIKSIVEYIIEKKDIKLTQKQIREIFKVHVLKIENTENKNDNENKENKEN